MLKDTLPRLYAQPCGRRLAWTCLAYRAANPAISNRNSGQTQQAGGFGLRCYLRVHMPMIGLPCAILAGHRPGRDLVGIHPLSTTCVPKLVRRTNGEN